jgi:hypothetical protein
MGDMRNKGGKGKGDTVLKRVKEDTMNKYEGNQDNGARNGDGEEPEDRLCLINCPEDQKCDLVENSCCSAYSRKFCCCYVSNIYIHITYSPAEGSDCWIKLARSENHLHTES